MWLRSDDVLMMIVVVVVVVVVVFWGVFMLSINGVSQNIPFPFAQLRNHPGQVRELPAIAQRFFGGCFHSCWINEHGCVWKCGAYVHAIYDGFNGEMGFETMNFGWYFWKKMWQTHITIIAIVSTIDKDSNLHCIIDW